MTKNNKKRQKMTKYDKKDTAADSALQNALPLSHCFLKKQKEFAVFSFEN